MLLSAHAEPALGRTYHVAASIEEVYDHMTDGARIVRYVIIRDQMLLHETFRPFAKFGQGPAE